MVLNASAPPHVVPFEYESGPYYLKYYHSLGRLGWRLLSFCRRTTYRPFSRPFEQRAAADLFCLFRYRFNFWLTV